MKTVGIAIFKKKLYSYRYLNQNVNKNVQVNDFISDLLVLRFVTLLRYVLKKKRKIKKNG